MRIESRELWGFELPEAIVDAARLDLRATVGPRRAVVRRSASRGIVWSYV